jgi:hypothetical protein
MSSVINLVQGDNRPFVTLSLTDDAGSAIDLSDTTTTVRIYFRSVQSKEVLTIISTTKVNDGVTGKVIFNFPGDTLEVKPGHYFGDVEIDFDGEVQTVFEPLQFHVREKFATSV